MIKGCLKSIIMLVLLVALAVGLFLNRERVMNAWHDFRGREAAPAGPSQELADAAASKLDDLKAGDAQSVSLSETELQSLLQYKYLQLLPAFVDSPSVDLDGDKITVNARVPLEQLPSLSELGEVAAFLPDTTELSVSGKLLPLSNGRVALAVDQVRAARIPLPRRLISSALGKLGRKEEAGLPRDALALPLPPGADAAYVRGDSLVFLKQGRAN